MSDIKYAYYRTSIGYVIEGRTNQEVLLDGGSTKALSTFYTTDNFTPIVTRLRGTTSGVYTSGDLTIASGANVTVTQSGSTITIASTDTNTTYTAGNGLTLSGTVFSLPVTTSGTGNVVTGVTQNTNGITVTYGTMATQSDLNNYIPLSQKGVANGVATLGADGLIPSTQLPSYVDDVLEFDNLASFPTTGETGKIYTAKDTNRTYRWGGSTYIQITSGAVDSVNGQTGAVTLTTSNINEGTNQYFTTSRARQSISLTTTGSGNATYNSTTGVLNIPNTTYTLPTASSSVTGGTKLFSDTVQSVVANAVTATAARTYGIQVNSSGQLVVNVPWTDANTTYTGSTSVILNGSAFERAALTGDVTASQNSNATTIANNAVNNAKLADMAQNTIKGRVSSGAGDPEDLTALQVRTIIATVNEIALLVSTPALSNTVTHNWNTRKVSVFILDTVTNYQIYGRIKLNTVNQITVEFDTLPPNAYEIQLERIG
jgi:hypothetical protein